MKQTIDTSHRTLNLLVGDPSTVTFIRTEYNIYTIPSLIEVIIPDLIDYIIKLAIKLSIKSFITWKSSSFKYVTNIILTPRVRIGQDLLWLHHDIHVYIMYCTTFYLHMIIFLRSLDRKFSVSYMNKSDCCLQQVVYTPRLTNSQVQTQPN